MQYYLLSTSKLKSLVWLLWSLLLTFLLLFTTVMMLPIIIAAGYLILEEVQVECSKIYYHTSI
jgi:hypothetical protein